MDWYRSMTNWTLWGLTVYSTCKYKTEQSIKLIFNALILLCIIMLCIHYNGRSFRLTRRKLIIGSYFSNYSKTITHQAEIFQGKFSTIVDRSLPKRKLPEFIITVQVVIIVFPVTVILKLRMNTKEEVSEGIFKEMRARTRTHVILYHYFKIHCTVYTKQH